MNRLTVCLMGASTDTGNLGVSALCLSILAGLVRREPQIAVTVFDNRRGDGAEAAEIDGRAVHFRRNGLNDSRRFYRRDSLWNVRLSGRLGGVGNPAVDALRRADAVLDVTGGDSFTDLYGTRRFKSGAIGKRLALEYSGGLVLMPQTYGPYRRAAAWREAAELVLASEAAWARDAASHGVMRELLGHAFDPSRHRCGVDVAFRLPANEPRAPLPRELASFLERGDGEPVVGVNVSGLTWNRVDAARRDYGLVADYRATVLALLDQLLAKTRARIVIVPHVHAEPTSFESDGAAAAQAIERLGVRARSRVVVAPQLDASETKGLVARLDWFCGTRMHSTIAALSSGVPAAAFAYSVKTRGVFETCGVGACVADLRSLDAAAAADVAWRAYEARADWSARLAEHLPRVLLAADRQMDEVVAVCRRLAVRRRSEAPASAF